jgi:hypothetical protein
MPTEPQSTLPGALAAALDPATLRVEGDAVVYRLYDVGYEIHLDRALELLATQAPARVRPVRGEAQALQITNPPLTVILGSEEVVLGGARHAVEVSARLFDFGVVSLRAQLAAPPRGSWADFSDWGRALDDSSTLRALLDGHVRSLVERLGRCIERPVVAPVIEDYIVFRLASLTDTSGAPVAPARLHDTLVAPLLLNEPRALSTDALRELLPHRFSYTADDLAIVTWENALVAEPGVLDSDVQFILEFANAQLLELRYYDALLDAELPKMYERIAAQRSGGAGRLLLSRRLAPVMSDLQRLVADSTELVERVENALKVTDDVYLARVYAAALELFRGRAWRAGIDRKLGIIRDTYAMLNDEAQAARSEALEVAIVLLIVLEIVLALVRH